MNKYKNHNFFFLRRPILSLTELDGFERKITKNSEVFEDKIIRLFKDPIMLEGLYLASPGFYEHFLKVISGEYSGDSVRSICESLYKYFLRMTSRPTPYGLFAGAVTGFFEDVTTFNFQPSGTLKKARLDMNYLNELYLSITSLPYIKSQLKYKPNSSIYSSGERYRYISYTIKNRKREYVISAVTKSNHLEKVLKMCQGEAVLISELTKILATSEISIREATTYVESLIEAQILVSDLEPSPTGAEYFNLFKEKLGSLKDTERILDHLNKISYKLNLQDYKITKYNEIKNIITTNYVFTEATDLVQVDTFFDTTKASISKEIPETILKEIEELSPLFRKFPNSNLEKFKQKFYARFEEKEVNLLEVLDSELGIGYDKAVSGTGDYLPLIEDIKIPAINQAKSSSYGDWEKIASRILKKSIEENLKIINLTQDDLKEIEQLNFNAELPNSFFIMGTLESDSLENLESKEYLFSIKALSGPTSVRLLGRFCHGDEVLQEAVKEALLEEEILQSDKIFAEVAHIPEARVGNILARPHLREYEIPFMSGSSLPEDKQILPNDLYVSVPNGERIKIVSKRLGKEVVPRITNAHNFSNGLTLYKFLGDLQSQDESVFLNWSWGIHENSIFLPRVQYKHLILEKAKWNLIKENIPLLNNSKSLTTKDVLAILETLDVPQWMILVEGENEFPINTKNPIAIKILTDKLKKYGGVVLAEYLGNHKNSWLKNEQNQPLANEIIIPCIKNVVPQPRIPRNREVLSDINIKRVFPLGSEWLYLKVYTGTKTADKILVEIIKPLAEEALKEGIIEKWFFIRYNDPDNHLRLRFYSSNPSVLWKNLLERLYTRLNPWVENSQIINYQLDTYKREIERYTPSAIDDIETWFYADSSFIVELIDAIEGEEGEQYRWLLGARAIDGILNGLGYSLEEKRNILSSAKEGFFTEFNGNSTLMVNLNDNYRKVSKSLTSIMNKSNDQLNEIAEFARYIDLHHQATSALKQALETKISTEQIYSITPSLIHMFMNRLFISNQRTHELVLYHYLFKFYNSLWVRQKKNMVKGDEVE